MSFHYPTIVAAALGGALALWLAWRASGWLRSLLLRRRVERAFREGRWGEVVALLRSPAGRRLAMSEPSVHERLAVAYKRLHKYEDAARVYRNLLSMGEGSREDRKRWGAAVAELDDRRYYGKGVTFFTHGRYEAALRCFQRVKDSAACPMLPCYMVHCALGLDRSELAAEYCAKLVPRRLPLDVLYGVALACEENGLYEQAKELYEHILRQDVSFKDVTTRIDVVKDKLRSLSSSSCEISLGRDLLDFIRSVVPSHFVVEKKLGSGGMGVVCLAFDKIRGLPVALKVLSPVLAEDPEIRARFLNEAKALMRLDHSNIIRIFEVGEENIPYYAMEYLKGKSLKEYIEEGPLCVRDVIYIALQIARAMEHAHDEGIIHRDIKPDNILIEDRGLIKLVDFGLAKWLDATSITSVDSFVGTQYYMSPEQIRREPLDGRTDVYSFGVTLYEASTGMLPFPDNPLHDHLHKVPPAPHELRPAVGRRLSRIVTRCMEKERDRRYSDFYELEMDLMIAMKEAARNVDGEENTLFF